MRIGFVAVSSLRVPESVSSRVSLNVSEDTLKFGILNFQDNDTNDRALRLIMIY